MRSQLTAAVIGLIVLMTPGLAATPATGQSSHDRAFWRGIVQHEYAPPAGESVPQLARELSQMLGSPDPEQRDEFAYSILTAWIYQKRLIDPAGVRLLMAEWQRNLATGIGATNGDGVFRRSFSALMLCVVAARDNADPFLDAAEFHQLLGSALTYLSAERDVRGYSPDAGWMHSAAHTADLLKFLARSRFIAPADQRVVLDAITAKMTHVDDVFTHGEDERYARAILSVIRRTDFDADGFKSWISQSTPVNPTTSKPDAATLHHNQNVKNLFAKLEVLLSLEPKPSPAVVDATAALRAALAKMF